MDYLTGGDANRYLEGIIWKMIQRSNLPPAWGGDSRGTGLGRGRTGPQTDRDKTVCYYLAISRWERDRESAGAEKPRVKLTRPNQLLCSLVEYARHCCHLFHWPVTSCWRRCWPLNEGAVSSSTVPNVIPWSHFLGCFASMQLLS